MEWGGRPRQLLWVAGRSWGPGAAGAAVSAPASDVLEP